MTGTTTSPFRACLRLLLGAALLWLAGCAAPEKPPARLPAPVAGEPVPPAEVEAAETIRIGLLLPLSGEYGEIGRSLLNAASFAVFDSGDRRLVLRPRDTLGTPAGAAAAAEALVAEGVDIFVGPLLGPSIRAAAPLAEAQGIKVLGLSNDRRVAGNGVYVMGFMPEEEVFRIVDYATLQGFERYAALVPRTPYGERVGNAFVAEVLYHGEDITDFETYPPDAVQLFEPVKKLAHYEERAAELKAERRFLESLGEDDLAEEILKELEKIETLGNVDYEAILIPEGAALLRTLAPLLPYYDVDPEKVKFLGTGLWHDETLVREPQLIGGWFAAPSPVRAQKFSTRYKEQFRHDPPRIATLAYDAVALIATLSVGLPAPDFSDETLTGVNGFSGIDGPFRFRTDGVVERQLAVLEVTRRGFRTLSPAPESFIPQPEVQLVPPQAIRKMRLLEQARDDAVEDGAAAGRDFEGVGALFDQIEGGEIGKGGGVDEPVEGSADAPLE